MIKRISKRTREEAAQVLSMMAHDRRMRDGGSFGYFEFVPSSFEAIALAKAAYETTPFFALHGRIQWHMRYAEAEALIRTGWAP